MVALPMNCPEMIDLSRAAAPEIPPFLRCLLATLRSISGIAHQQRRMDDCEFLEPDQTLLDLCDARELCGRLRDAATARLIEMWINQAERRPWFLSKIVCESGIPLC